jgi:hypothetical protein
VLFATALALLLAAPASAAGGDVLVSNGSPTGPFSQNKQNEPAMAIDANHPNIVVAGSNDEIDEEACNAGDPTRCPFTPGIGVSGFYYSTDSGKTWTQPSYTGLTARNCLGPVSCTPMVGTIGTIPWYFENGLVADGDPALAFGPKPDSSGAFSWANGSRLYYANLTSNLSAVRSEESFSGFEAIAVSRTDDVATAGQGGDTGKNAWKQPVLVSNQSNTTFSDKEQVWADNASSSPFFGTVYVCWANFKGNGRDAAAPLIVAASSDGGDTWTQHPISAAANNSQVNPMDGCTVRTDSQGNAYVFGIATSSSAGHRAFEFMSVSSNGGHNWTAQDPVVGPVNQPGAFDSVLGRPTIDGIAGARSDLAPAPSVDIANGAPTGTDATDRIVMSYVSGSLATPHIYFTESADRGATWSSPRAIETGSADRGYYTAPAISPNGTDVYVVYNAFTTPYQTDTKSPRLLVGVLLHASVGPLGTGKFAEVHRGAPGDARASSQNNLVGEFLGDYVYAAATRTYGAGVWNDSRNGADCPAIDTWRMFLRTGGTTVLRPEPQQACAANFGNSDIYGFTTAP